MILITTAVVAIFLSYSSPVSALKCHEGINMTLNSIPVYFWKTRECDQNSKCIGQEMSVDIKLSNDIVLNNAMRYGACMSNVYAEYLDCNNLFGKDAKVDLTKLLDMVPGIEKSINKAVESFIKNISGSLSVFLSDGRGMEYFVDGIYKFYKNLGFNLEKAEPLKLPISNFLKAFFKGITSPQVVSADGIIEAMANLQTDNKNFSTNLRKLLIKFEINATTVVDLNPTIKILVDKIPGLVRSVFPANWKADIWYDVPLNMVGDIDPTDWTTSARKLADRVKTSYQVPSDIQPYVYPFLDRLSDLVTKSQGNPLYLGNWSLGLLQHFGEVDQYTEAFSISLTNFIEEISRATLQYEFKSTIQLLPGLFYKMFPGDKADIQKVYQTMNNTFKSFKFDALSYTTEETSLSKMTFFLIEKIGGAAAKQNINADPLYTALINNFAKMFTDLLKVKEDYTEYLEKFSTVVTEEFKNYPNINVGSFITKLITTYGAKVPQELNLLLSNVQAIVTAGMNGPFDAKKLVDAMHSVVAAYKSDYPNSPFPELVDRLISIVYNLTTIDYGMTWESYNRGQQEAQKLNMELQYWNIDLQFAIIKSYDYDNDELYKRLVEFFPSYEVYIRALKTMKAEDVKELMKAIARLTLTRNVTSQKIVDAIKPTLMKITGSVKNYIADFRHIFAPNTCQFGSCGTDMCNSQSFIASRQKYIKPSEPPRLYETTTSSAGMVAECNIAIAIAVFVFTMFMKKLEMA